MKAQRLGWMIVVVSIIVLALLGWHKIESDRQNLSACESACGGTGSESCTLATCPYHQRSSTAWIINVVGIMVASLSGVGLYLAFAKTELIVHEKEYDLTGLSDDEKNLFLLVKSSNGGIYQSELVERLGISKVKATRILDNIEQQGYIERKRRGMTNLVVLK